MIDLIQDRLYGIGPEGLGLCGMDDAGEMSAWYVFTALGLYPFSPADTDYLVTVPLFDQVKWQTSTGKELVIRKPQASRDLKAIEVNGRQLPGYFLSHDLFRQGGTVRILTGQ
jgi:putative alpha-1,2-mannosidase